MDKTSKILEQKKTEKKRPRFSQWLLIIPSFLGLFLLGYFATEIFLKPPVESLAKKITSLQTTLKQQQQSVQQLSNDVTANRKRINNEQARPLEPLPDHLLISEMNYLLKLAHYHLVYSQDIDSAKRLLTLALESLGENPKPKWLAFKKTITDHLAQLNALKANTQETILDPLSTLSTLIPLLNKAEVEPTTSNKIRETNENPTPLSIKNRVWQYLKTQITVQREDHPVALVTIKAIPVVQQTMQLLVAQTNYAVITHNEALYQRSLKQLSDLTLALTEHNAALSQIKQTLAHLATQSVQENIPNLSDSFAELDHLSKDS